MMWSLIHSPQYRAFALQERWRRIRSAFYIPKVIQGPKFQGQVWPARKWWWLPMKLLDRWAYVTWRSPMWWSQHWSDLRWVHVRSGLWLGVLQLQEGGWYKDAQWRWAFWRTPYSVWQMRSPYRTVCDVVDTLCKRFYV